MTTQKWTDQMVDQLAASVTELRQSISEQRQSDQETRDLVNSNARVIQALATATAEAQEERDAATRERQAILERIDEMTTDIRGLQIENQRMLDLLFEHIRRNNEENE
ncbi:UNVERIFIED_CONTAM: hypothetical protein BEN50_13230 [Euhalothece sp. KZN 001]